MKSSVWLLSQYSTTIWKGFSEKNNKKENEIRELDKQKTRLMCGVKAGKATKGSDLRGELGPANDLARGRRAGASAARHGSILEKPSRSAGGDDRRSSRWMWQLRWSSASKMGTRSGSTAAIR
jgi:hypothetical protein